MIKRLSTNVLSAALGSALLLSGLAVWAFVPAGPEDAVAAVELPLSPVETRSEQGETTDPSPHSPALTREWVRAWAEKQDLPEARLAPLTDGLTPFDAIADSIGPVTPKDAHETAVHRADQAHALGFDGTGIRVAVIDTGIDFAHPDLLNVTARITNASSPYYLHPIAYDGASMNDYLLFGQPGPNSWYVNTSFSTRVFELPGGTRHVSRTDTGGTNQTWEVTGVSGLAPGEEVRLGFHPDKKLQALWGVRPALLLFNGTGSGAPFDRVLTDLDADRSFAGETAAWVNTDWATFDPEAELLTHDIDMDGVQDLSGGMLYFIADGVREIPYASRQVDTLNLALQSQRNNNSFDIWADMGVDPTTNVVPGEGDLVLLFGDFDVAGVAGSHGTWVTSALAGQGITGGGSVGPVLKGMAPGAKIIGAGNNFAGADPFVQMSLWTSLIFATEGYDGVPGTEDEAHIASNSWGSSDWTGWEWGSRFADYVSTVLASERTLFVFAAGNSGPGYGGRSGPAGGPSLLVAGSVDNYNHRTDPWRPQEGGPNPAWGETTWFSNRGPSALGRHYVDAQASGQFGYGADPLNGNRFEADSGTDLNGSSSWVLWAGTSLATPNLSGIAALIYDAYLQAHAGTAPLAPTAKAIVKASADDAHQDPFMTGAGIANAHRGVLIASEMDGLTTSLDEWYPGDYRGVVYPGYTQVLPPGGMDSVLVSATNHRPSASMNVDVEDAVLARTGSVSMSFNRFPLSSANEFILNDTGILSTSGSILRDAPAGLFTSADVVRVTMFFDRDRMAEVPAYLLLLFDWTDVDASGTFSGFNEENLMVQDWVSLDVFNGPNGFGFIHDPANRTHDGVMIRLSPEFEGRMIPRDVQFTLQIDYFKRTDFPWLEVAPTSLVIPAASSAPMNLTVTVPGDADPGLYEAVVLFRLDNGNVTTVPVVVNVVASVLPFAFGGNTHDSGPYQQGVQYGQRWGDVEPIASGDFRYYFLDLAVATNVTVFLGWDDAASDHEIYVLSNVTDWFSETLPSRYGPGSEATVAFTAVGARSAALRASANPGLSIIVSRSTALAGISVEEHPVGQAGNIAVTPLPWAAAGIPLNGSETFTIVSDIGFPDVTGSVETGRQLTFVDEPVASHPCGTCQTNFVGYLFRAPTRLKTELTAGIERADYTLFFHSGARDVDMGIFYDNTCLGAYTVQNDVIGSVASTNRNPEVASIRNPAPGCYWVHAAGFDVDPGSLFDLTVTLVTLPLVTITSLPPRIDPGTPASVTVNYSLPPAPETVAGTFFIGSSQFPRAIPIPLALTPDLPPLFSNETPGRDAIINDATPTISVEMRDWPDPFETAVDTATVEITLDGVDFTGLATITPNSVTLPLAVGLADGSHAVTVNASDEKGSGSTHAWGFTVDTALPTLVVTSPVATITNDPSVVVAGSTESTANLTVNGEQVSVDASGAFQTTLILSEGVHSIDVVATDAANNSNTVTVEIEVDVTPPALTLTSPADGATTGDPSVQVSGTTEPDALVEVNGVGVNVASDGSFSHQVTLVDGANAIMVNATDVVGNRAGVTVTVTLSNLILLIVVAGVLGVVAVVATVVLLLPWLAKRTGGRFPRLPFMRKRER